MEAAIARVTRRPPDFVIGGADRPYLRRWWIVRTRLCAIYLHEILRDDDDRALHDHPWANASIVLRGGYVEVVPGCERWPTCRACPPARRARRAGAIVCRRASAAHRLELTRDAGGTPVPCWSLFLCGPKVRSWGFWCPQGWRHWRDFVDARDTGVTGRGCA